MIAGQTEPRNTPARNVAKTKGPASSNDARQGRAAGVGRAKNAAHASSGNARNRDVVPFEHLQNPQVRETAREASAQGQANAWQWRWNRVADWAGLVFALHGTMVAIHLVLTNGPRVPRRQYGCTFPRTSGKFLPVSQNSTFLLPSHPRRTIGARKPMRDSACVRTEHFEGAEWTERTQHGSASR